MNVSGLGEKAALLFWDHLDPWVAAGVDFDIHIGSGATATTL